MLAELRGHQGPARADFVPRSGALVSAGEEDGTLRTWSRARDEASRRDPEPLRVFSRDGRLVVSGDADGPDPRLEPRDRQGPRARRPHATRATRSSRRTAARSSAHRTTGRVRLWDVADRAVSCRPDPRRAEVRRRDRRERGADRHRRRDAARHPGSGRERAAAAARAPRVRQRARVQPRWQASADRIRRWDRAHLERPQRRARADAARARGHRSRRRLQRRRAAGSQRRAATGRFASGRRTVATR